MYTLQCCLTTWLSVFTKWLHPCRYLPVLRLGQSARNPSVLYTMTLVLVLKPPVMMTVSSIWILQAYLVTGDEMVLY